MLKRTLILGALFFVLATLSLNAANIDFSFTGTGSGSIGGTSFTNDPFAVSISADTANLAYQTNLAAYGYENLAGTIDISGVGTASFNDPLFVFGGNGTSNIGFGEFVNGNLIALFDLAATGFDLQSNFGPITDTNYNLNQFSGVNTSLGTLNYNTMSPVTFSASVPEPGTLLLVGLGVLSLAARRRPRRA